MKDLYASPEIELINFISFQKLALIEAYSEDDDEGKNDLVSNETVVTPEKPPF